MFFSFTFNIPTPFANPFDGRAADPGQPDYTSPERGRRLGPRPPRPSVDSTPEGSPNISRKRGRWSPEAKARASSVLDLSSTASAYIEPARYVDFSEERAEPEEDINEIRAPKRRRIAELADTVISTAFSAAVISTALGVTAFRLWRDRGKDGLPVNPEPSIESLPPPPPYTPRIDSSSAGPSYVPITCSAPSALKKNNMNSAPISTPRRRANAARRPHAHASTARRRRPISSVLPRNQSPVSSLRRSTAYFTAPDSSRNTPAPGPSGPSSLHGHDSKPDVASGDELDNEDMEMTGQMDWMSSQLQALINEGKRALGTEVVVDGDEEDDGRGGWTSADEDGKPKSAHSRAPSRAVTRPVLARPASRASKPRQSTCSIPRARSGSVSGSSSVKKHEEDEFGIEVLYQSPLRSAPSAKVGPSNEGDGTSEELRVAMERVRKAYGLAF
ncbi:unnamed protein product [Rhizoctonia solani]|nr:unnamed protein product [Rhizoctonia solani]